MKPVKFRGMNVDHVGGKLLDPWGRKIDPLPTFTGEGLIISCWAGTLRERLHFLLTGRAFLSVMGNRMPPVGLSTNCPLGLSTNCPLVIEERR